MGNNMINFDDIHFIENGDVSLLLHVPSFTLVSLSSDTANILKSLKEGASISDVAQNSSISLDEIENCLLKLEDMFKKNLPPLKPNPTTDVADRITLHISNDCNLRCKYCYASGGNYKMKRSLMTTDTAKQFYDFCIHHFSHIEKIVFFGGEPCLNLNVMEYVCSLFNSYKFDDKLKDMPKFAIITNGTILNERLLKIIRTYISYITVSIDGNKEFNDYNRLDKAGNGSFDRIAKFIDTVKQIDNVTIQYESTFTKYHIRKGISRDEIASYMSKRFGIRGFVVDEMNVKEHKDAYSINNLENLPESFTSILWAISFKKPLVSCQMSSKQFAVLTLGEIFPCHMDVGKECLNLGNIGGKNIFNSCTIQKSFPLFDLLANKRELCPNCWAHNLCEGCPRELFYDEKNKCYQTTPNEDKCKSQREHIEKILLSISHLRQDKNKWYDYVQGINKMRSEKIC